MDATEEAHARALQHGLHISTDAPFGHLHLTILDHSAPTLDTKRLSEIYTGTSNGETYKHDSPQFKKGIKFTHALHGAVFKEDIIKNLTPDATAYGPTLKLEVGAAKKYPNGFQTTNCSTIKSWHMRFTESVVKWEDMKVSVHNAKRMGTKLCRRTQGMSNARYTANRAVGLKLLEAVDDTKARVVSRIEAQIEGIDNGTRSVFEDFRERSERGMSEDTLERLKTKEVRRLEAHRDEIQAWPENQWAPDALAEGQQDSGLLGDELDHIAERDPVQRKAFFIQFAKKVQYLASANRATADSFEFVQSIMQQAAFRAWKVSQFCAICDLMLTNIIELRMANEMLSHAVEIQYRVAIPFLCDQVKTRQHFQTIRNMIKQYNKSDNARGGQPRPSFQHMLVSASTTMDSIPDRAPTGNIAPANDGLLSGLPADFAMDAFGDY
ncbi:unnamed protein product [Zymoseptoria tritici ST99CH_3D7]|uniref:Uncharacterized protein n=1 Tax=Zymoseptoria tritici (strain ST99CH_3D7) TaxID=1276538 RepID=A0A1X7RDH4_ZYMT9|nr:unnamed protein product [Zymoseptoria tritici ST99CH_3D7]